MKDIIENKTEEDFEANWLKTFRSDEFDLNPIGFNEAFIVFHLRYVTAEELNAIYRRMNALKDLSDAEQTEKVFEIYRESLGRFSTKSPTIQSDGTNHQTTGQPTEVMNRLFPKFEQKAWKLLNKAFADLVGKNNVEEVFP